jgi:hypothetical protein
VEIFHFGSRELVEFKLKAVFLQASSFVPVLDAQLIIRNWYFLEEVSLMQFSAMA